MSMGINPDAAFIAEALQFIETISRNVSMEITLTELQLVVERMSFSGLAERQPQDDVATMAEIDLYFRDELREPMVSFLHWMASRNMLGVLSGRAGLVFLDHCIKKYAKVSEVVITTAVSLDADYEQHLADRLRAVHPLPARILFAVQPNLVAGLTIDVGHLRIDRSLRTFMATTIPRSAKIEDVMALEQGDEDADGGDLHG
jgi:F0F1-type ATP synthase delta subunit